MSSDRAIAQSVLYMTTYYAPPGYLGEEIGLRLSDGKSMPYPVFVYGPNYRLRAHVNLSGPERVSQDLYWHLRGYDGAGHVDLRLSFNNPIKVW